MSNKSTRVEHTHKPKKCPECGQAPLSNILYGMPAFDEAFERKMNEGRVAIGGCCVGDDDPAWECTHCGLKIFQRQVQ